MIGDHRSTSDQMVPPQQTSAHLALRGHRLSSYYLLLSCQPTSSSSCHTFQRCARSRSRVPQRAASPCRGLERRRRFLARRTCLDRRLSFFDRSLHRTSHPHAFRLVLLHPHTPLYDHNSHSIDLLLPQVTLPRSPPLSCVPLTIAYDFLRSSVHLPTPVFDLLLSPTTFLDL